MCHYISTSVRPPYGCRGPLLRGLLAGSPAATCSPVWASRPGPVPCVDVMKLSFGLPTCVCLFACLTVLCQQRLA
jgi:hypothetical protein